MSDKPEFDAEGLRVGDFHVRVVPVGATSDDLDTAEGRERARRSEEDRRLAQHGAGGEPIAFEGEAIAAEDVAESIEEARERAASGGDVPILIRDPVTGIVIEKP